MADRDPVAYNPLEQIMTIGAGLWTSRALWTAARLRLADQIGNVPRAAEEIAEEIGADPEMLRRLLNALAAANIFACNAEGRFAHGALSPYLRSDHPASQRAFIESVFGDEHYMSWGQLDRSVMTGITGFNAAYGEPVFDWFGKNPDRAALFSEAMTSTTKIMEAGLLASYEFAPFALAIDIGGSRGTLLAGLLEQQPEARGMLFDLPEIVAPMRPALEGTRIEGVAGNFFESVPAGGDLYLMKFILHDWTDAQCALILKNIRAAIKEGGRLAIFENVLPEMVVPHPGYLMDLNMMAMTGGRERKASEFAAMLAEAGFRQTKVSPTGTFLSIIEAEAI